MAARPWRGPHGIADSIWVTPRATAADRRALESVAAEITKEVGIRLEHESAFDWVAFCPLRDGDAGALTRYYGRRADPCGEAFKLRGIEARQRSTCGWVEDLQRNLIAVLDETRDPGRVCQQLRSELDRLQRGEIPPGSLITKRRVSKAPEEYTHRTRTVVALERAVQLGLSPAPGEDVAFVVVDDEKQSIDRVRLKQEVDATTDADLTFYRDRAVRAATSVLSPCSWERQDIIDGVTGTEEWTLANFC